jgi:hypothetical protein
MICLGSTAKITLKMIISFYSWVKGQKVKKTVDF